jgi:hypothetical protein
MMLRTGLIMSTINAFIGRHPVLTDDTLAFGVS